MTSATTWFRLEPRARARGMARGLEARLWDPLWMLARQWQFGEFRGEDAGTPAVSEYQMEAVTISHYRAGAGGAAHEIDRAAPLERLVEREPVRTPTHRDAAEAGLHWLRVLRAARAAESTLAAYSRRYPLGTVNDAATEFVDAGGRIFSIMLRHAPDGVRLYPELRAALDAPGVATMLPGLDEPGSASERTLVRNAAARWLAWYEAMIAPRDAGDSAWNAERLEYAFAVGGSSADGEAVVSASEYHGGAMDWYSFSTGGDPLGLLPASRADVQVHAAMPAPATFRGMPNARWWEFEDARIDFGAAEVEPDDLGRMLLIEYALVYGNDWFVMPVDVGVGTLARPRSLVVTDSFGVRTLVAHYAASDASDRDWRLFSLTLPEAPDQLVNNALFVPPTVADTLESGNVEEVLFVRDEMANLAWAIERTVEGVTGRGVRLDEVELRRDTPLAALSEIAIPPDHGDRLRYRLAAETPRHWIPLLPELTADGNRRLRRGAWAGADGRPVPQSAYGLIVATLSTLFDEEVPRAGARVTRRWQYARWHDGSSHVWLARQKRSGHGEGSSGLRFDVVSGQ